MSGKSGKFDMCSGPILPGIIAFSVPLMLSSWLQLLFNAADVIVVGRFAGSESLAAVGSTSSLVNLLTNLFIGLSIGANVMTALTLGSGDREGTKDNVHTAISLSLLSGVALVVIGLLFTRPLLVWMDTPDDVLEKAALYLKIIFIGMPANMAYNFGSAILRSTGETRKPLYYLSAAGVLNIALNLFFVIALHMDVAGVALATVLSESLSAVLILHFLCTTDGPCRLDIRRLYIQPARLRRMLHIGLPAGIQSSLFSFSNVLIQSAINSFGSAVVAGSSAAATIENFVYMATNSIHQATVSFTSQNVGAKKPERIGRILHCSLGCVTVLGLTLGILVNLFSVPLLSAYSTEPDVIAAGQIRLLWVVTPYFLCGVMETVMGVMRGLGYAIAPMLVALSGACLFRIVWLVTIFAWFPTQQVLYLSYLFSWILTSFIHYMTYRYARRHHPIFLQEK
ncbi:MAG: MATE family efflux transporter [Lachnospiraceae bacterium]|nr:MATE family efflux transporter [Lachnospiraceae bacterium]